MYLVVVVLHGMDPDKLLKSCSVNVCSKMLMASHFIITVRAGF